LDSTLPYEEVYAHIDDSFMHERCLSLMAKQAESVGIRNFKKLYSEYTKALKKASSEIYISNSTNFSGQKLELNAGDWECDDFGISKQNSYGSSEVACPHPIMPIERLVNIDTGEEKLKIAFSKGKRWREIIVDKRTLAAKNSIVTLAGWGVSVTSESAAALVKYIADIENLNFDQIPEKKSISRLGHIQDEGFSPYVDGLVFDGDANYKTIFESIRQHGDRRKWLDTALEIRQGNVMARVVLATSFASPLVSVVGGLPFFVHLWGGDSGTGKTVALMLAASVWANPEMGRYIQTFNSTVVGREKLASFLNHLPLLVDELQLAKDSRGRMMFDVYALAEGVGRTRGTKTGGIERTPTWANTIITTGESPITSTNSASGATNRVIDVECTASQRIIEDGRTTSIALKKNYGFAGREFVDKLYLDDNTERANELYSQFYKTLNEGDTTEKQAMAAAIILTADALATEWIFQDGQALTVDDVSKFLASKSAASAGEKGYRYMCDWVSQNINKLRPEIEQGEVYGVVEGEYAYIINSVFRRAVEDAGYSAGALISYLKENDLILTRTKNNTRGKRILGVLTECVVMRISTFNDDEEQSNDELPDF
jgi:hypothetical protein